MAARIASARQRAEVLATSCHRSGVRRGPGWGLLELADLTNSALLLVGRPRREWSMSTVLVEKSTGHESDSRAPSARLARLVDPGSQVPLRSPDSSGVE